MKVNELIRFSQILEELIALQSSSLDGEKKYYKKLVKELNSCKKYFIENKSECLKEFHRSYQERSQLLDFNIYQHIDLFLLFSESFYYEPKPIFNITNKEQHQQLISFGWTLCNLTNSLIAMRSLLEQGFDLQAKQLFRSYIEYSDIAIASLASIDFYQNYKRMAESKEDENDVWWNYTRPKAITKILKEIYLTFDEDGKFWEMVNMIREPSYDYYSGHVHGHFMANTYSALSQGVGKELYQPTISGVVTTNMRDTLDRSICYSHLVIKHAMIILVKDQKIPFNKFGEQGEKFVMFYKMMEMLWPIMLKELKMFAGEQPPTSAST